MVTSGNTDLGFLWYADHILGSSILHMIKDCKEL